MYIFIDDKIILEIIFINEVVYYVWYGVLTDNDLYGYDVNKVVIGVEFCYGGDVNFWEVYNCFIWYYVYLC